MALVDTLEEQALLEQVLDDSKPAVPEDCRKLHYLLFTPFRYGAAYPRGSRFRRVGLTPGVFYASLQATTAVAEMAFWRLMFYAESPETPWPANPGEYTAFSVRFSSPKGLDLTRPPLNRDAATVDASDGLFALSGVGGRGTRRRRALSSAINRHARRGQTWRCWRVRRLHPGSRWKDRCGDSTSARWASARFAISPSSGWRSIAPRSRAIRGSPSSRGIPGPGPRLKPGAIRTKVHI